MKTVNGIEDEQEAGNKTILRDPAHNWSSWTDSHDAHREDPITNWATDDWTQTNTILAADWDVLNEIRWTIEHNGVEGGEIFHIAGLQAQLNVDADRLATEFQDSFGLAAPEGILFPHAAANIHTPKYPKPPNRDSNFAVFTPCLGVARCSIRCQLECHPGEFVDS